MKRVILRPLRLLGMMLLGAAPLVGVTSLAMPAVAQAQELKGGTIRIAILNDMTNFDPMQFSTVNFHLIKNLYDSLIEYTPEGEAIPSLATAWEIAPDNQSVKVTLRDDVTFHSGAKFTSADVAATLTKASDPKLGKNVYATTSIIQDWTTPDDTTVVINFKQPIPSRQILDLLQFTLPIEAGAIADVETQEAGTGAYIVANRAVGQGITLTANPNYWRENEPVADTLEFTIFSDNDAAAAALESGSVDMIYGAQSRAAVRLRDAGYTLVDGPGKLVQIFRINTTRGPFTNEKFRQAFNYLMNREAILRAGYAGLGEVVALPWAPASPAFDASYTEKYAFNLEKAKELLAESGLSAEEMNNWKILVNGSNEESGVLSQIVQATLTEVGINIELEVRQGAEYVEAQLAGAFDTTFGGVGNVQKFPSRVATNSIYRTANNPVLGEPHPFPEYVEAIARVSSTVGTDAEVKASYDHLNEVLVNSSFGIPTNTLSTGLILASPKLDGFTLDMDNLLVARTIGFKE